MMTDVEFDRNQAAMALAALANAFGWDMGFQWIVDENDKDTGKVMLFVDTPWGVFRWELSPHEMIGQWREYKGRIPDEQDLNLRRIRMSKMIEALTAVKKQAPEPEKVEQPIPQDPTPPAPIVEEPKSNKRKTKKRKNGK